MRVRSSALGGVCAESYCNFPASAVEISNKKLLIKFPAHHKKREARSEGGNGNWWSIGTYVLCRIRIEGAKFEDIRYDNV